MFLPMRNMFWLTKIQRGGMSQKVGYISIPLFLSSSVYQVPYFKASSKDHACRLHPSAFMCCVSGGSVAPLLQQSLETMIKSTLSEAVICGLLVAISRFLWLCQDPAKKMEDTCGAFARVPYGDCTSARASSLKPEQKVSFTLRQEPSKFLEVLSVIILYPA